MRLGNDCVIDDIAHEQQISLKKLSNDFQNESN
jgi:hypothetical protein